MTIETKYNIGDEVYFLSDNKIEKNRIKSLLITNNEVSIIKIDYGIINCSFKYPEHLLFSTKEELIKSL